MPFDSSDTRWLRCRAHRARRRLPGPLPRSWGRCRPPTFRVSTARLTDVAQSSGELRIRVATAADWPAIWPFLARIVADGRTYALPEDVTCAQAREIWMAPGHVVVAEVVGQVVGSARMGPNRPGRGSHVATASFMVDPTARGLGVGRAMGQYALDWARTCGFRAMQFNAVVETNTAAVALWRSLGFEIIGTVPDAFDDAGAGLVGLHIMYRRL